MQTGIPSPKPSPAGWSPLSHNSPLLPSWTNGLPQRSLPLPPRSRPCPPHPTHSPRSKPWRTPLLTTLRKESTKTIQTTKKHQSPASFSLARQSKLGYFKAIKKVKSAYWADFLAKTSPQNIWTAKKFVAPRKTPRFPSLPEASHPVAINKALLDHFFPSKKPIPQRGRLSCHLSADSLTKEEIAYALSKSSPSSAPGPDSILYAIWKKVSHLNSGILLDLLSLLVYFGYHHHP